MQRQRCVLPRERPAWTARTCWTSPGSDASRASLPGSGLCSRRTRKERTMATPKQMRDWATTIRVWLTEVDDRRVTEFGSLLIAELISLAACQEATERQLV